MAEFTENYNLTCPNETSDYYDVNVQNGNMTIIDGALKEHADKLNSVTLFASEAGISAVDATIDLSQSLSDFKRIVVHYDYLGVAEQSFTLENYTTSFIIKQFNLANSPESATALNINLAEMYLKKETDTQFKIRGNRNITFDNATGHTEENDPTYNIKIHKIEGYYI